jgi:hypothetical protein
LLLRLRDVGDAVANAAIGSSENVSVAGLERAGRRMLVHNRVVGAAIHIAGGATPMLFGESPALTPGHRGDTYRSNDGNRFAIVAKRASPASSVAVVVNLDASWIGSEQTDLF